MGDFCWPLPTRDRPACRVGRDIWGSSANSAEVALLVTGGGRFANPLAYDQQPTETGIMTASPISKFVIAAVFALVSSANAFALDKKPFEAAAFKASQDAGHAILVDVYAPWCPTCQAQRKVLDGLKDNAAYKDITIYEVDFDTQTDALQMFGARTQSTLIAFKGAKETGRSAGETKQAAIEALLQSTLK